MRFSGDCLPVLNQNLVIIWLWEAGRRSLLFAVERSS